MRDVDGDADAGVRTVPVQLGRKGSLTFLRQVNAATGTALLAWAAADGAPLPFATAHVASVGFTELYLRRAARGGDLERLTAVECDGELIVSAAVALGVAFFQDQSLFPSHV